MSRKIRFIGSELPPPCALLTYTVKYPAWVFLSPNEWAKACLLRPGADVPGSVFARVSGKRTILIGYGENGVPFYRVAPAISEYKGNPAKAFMLEDAADFVTSRSRDAPDPIVPEDGVDDTPPESITSIQRWQLGGFGSASVNFVKE